MSISIFREYDIRGIFEKDLNEYIVKKIAYYFTKELLTRIPNALYISVGYDSRLHSPILKDWLTSGINYAGLTVLDMGMVPTPVNYFSNYTKFNNLSSDASIMITGSHNPSEFNGFKITINKIPFYAQDLYSLGKTVLNNNIDIPNNYKTIKINAKDKYIEYITNHFKNLNLSNKKFIFDCGNGVAGVVLREILDKLNINYDILFENPDGNFPNHHPNPSDESTLIDIKKELLDKKYDFGFAYDGDADRLALLSQKYNFKGDVLAIFLSKLIQNPIVIGEVKCSEIMYDTINSYGKAIMYKTGHSNLKVKIKEINASFAAEVSGHLFFNDRYFGYDDAIYSTLRILELIEHNCNLDEQYESLPKVYSTKERHIKVTDYAKFKIIDKLKIALQNPPDDFPQIKEIIDIDGLRVVFEKGWGLIRASNTTASLVTRFEAQTQKEVEMYERMLMKILKNLGEN